MDIKKNTHLGNKKLFIALAFIFVLMIGYMSMNIKEYNPVKNHNYGLITSNFSPMFSLFGTNYGFTSISDNVSRYDFGGSSITIFDKVIHRQSSHWHKVSFGLYRESDSYIN